MFEEIDDIFFDYDTDVVFELSYEHIFLKNVCIVLLGYQIEQV